LCSGSWVLRLLGSGSEDVSDDAAPAFSARPSSNRSRSWPISAWSATAQVRRHSAAALFKVYILKNEEAFFGFYPVVERSVTIKSTPTAICDVLGKDVPLPDGVGR
jgi:hypothetical protein